MSTTPPKNLSDARCWLECIPKSSCSKCMELENIDKQLAVAEQTIQGLQARRAAILQAVTARRDPVTTKLPFELVVNIFEQYVHMHKTDPDGYRYPLYPETQRPQLFSSIYPSAPLRLGAVCRLWRKIAWMHPHLWTTLDILLTVTTTTGPEIVSDWLSRTSNLPLSIRIHHPADIIDHDDRVAMAALQKNTRQIIGVINRHASHWGCLDFSEVPLDIVSKLDDTHCNNLDHPSMLQRVSFGDSLSPSLRDSNRKIFKTNRIHRPTHLHILATFHPERLPIEWTRLSHMHIESVDQMAFYFTLIMAQRKGAPLTHLSAACVIGREEWWPAEAIELASLTSLSIEEDEMTSTTPQDLFKTLKAPSLQSLKYTSRGDIPTPVNEFVELTKRSNCSIQTLHLITPLVSDAVLIAFLQALSSIKNLELDLPDENKASALLDALSQTELRSGKTPLLPKLMRLTIRALPPNKWASLVGLLADKPDELDDELQPPLRKGLQVDFTFKTARHVWLLSGTAKRRAQTKLVDKVSLSKLGQLHRKYGVVCVIKDAEDNYNGEGFLLESLRMQFPDIEMLSSNNLEYQNLLAMAKAGNGS